MDEEKVKKYYGFSIINFLLLFGCIALLTYFSFLRYYTGDVPLTRLLWYYCKDQNLLIISASYWFLIITLVQTYISWTLNKDKLSGIIMLLFFLAFLVFVVRINYSIDEMYGLGQYLFRFFWPVIVFYYVGKALNIIFAISSIVTLKSKKLFPIILVIINAIVLCFDLFVKPNSNISNDVIYRRQFLFLYISVLMILIEGIYKYLLEEDELEVSTIFFENRKIWLSFMLVLLFLGSYWIAFGLDKTTRLISGVEYKLKNDTYRVANIHVDLSERGIIVPYEIDGIKVSDIEYYLMNQYKIIDFEYNERLIENYDVDKTTLPAYYFFIEGTEIPYIPDPPNLDVDYLFDGWHSRYSLDSQKMYEHGDYFYYDENKAVTFYYAIWRKIE